jgi:hypothetical protein
MNRKDFENLEAGTLVTASMNSYEPGLLEVIRTEGNDVLVERFDGLDLRIPTDPYNRKFLVNSKQRWFKYQALKIYRIID